MEGTKINDKIIISSKDSVKKILNQMNGAGFYWAHISDEVEKSSAIEKEIGMKGSKIEIGQMINEISTALRREYIDYVGKINLEKNSIEWWNNEFSEKNLYLSKTFLYSCYILLCKRITEEYRGTVVLFIDDEILKKAVYDNLELDYSKIKKNRLRNLAENTKQTFELIKNRIIFLINNSYRLVLSKFLYNKQILNKELSVMYSFVNKNSFDNNGKFYERYFGELPKELEKNRENIAFMTPIWNASYFQTLKNMEKSRYMFIIPHSFLSFFDLLKVFFNSLKKPKKEKFQEFHGMDISDIIYDDLTKNWINRRQASDMLMYYVIKGMKKKNVQIKKIIYPYENQTWEKIVLLALKKYYPNTKSIAYQHCILSMMQLNYFFSKDEIKVLPLPSIVVSSGKHDEQLFIKEGYPKDKVKMGGSIRYRSVVESISKGKKLNKDNPTILVTPSPYESEALELIWKSYNAFKDRKKYNVIIKCHPILPFEKIQKYLKIDLPKNIVIANKPLNELLKETDILIYSSSTTSVEAIAQGIPVVRVKPSQTIEFNRFDFNSELALSARKPEEIVECVEAYLGMGEKELFKKRQEWINAVKYLFGKPEDSVYASFLK